MNECPNKNLWPIYLNILIYLSHADTVRYLQCGCSHHCGFTFTLVARITLHWRSQQCIERFHWYLNVSHMGLLVTGATLWWRRKHHTADHQNKTIEMPTRKSYDVFNHTTEQVATLSKRLFGHSNSSVQVATFLLMWLPCTTQSIQNSHESKNIVTMCGLSTIHRLPQSTVECFCIYIYINIFVFVSICSGEWWHWWPWLTFASPGSMSEQVLPGRFLLTMTICEIAR